MNKFKSFYWRFFNKEKYRNYIILKWIKDAKEFFLKRHTYYGMCCCFDMTFPKYFKKEYNKINYLSEIIKHFIPEYYPEFFGTHEIIYDEELDNADEEGYWWKLGDKEHRIKAFNKLIEIYKKKCVR